MRALSLFSGIGGLDLAAEAAGIEIVAMCEIEPFCQKVLHKHWPEIPIYSDVRLLKGEDVGAVELIFGGFPCQPFSVAGDQRGFDDERYLWPEFSRLVEEIRPVWVVGENVPGILRIAADSICKDLELKGYSVGIWDFEAASVGALHRRERIFFVGHAERSGLSRDYRRRTVQESADRREDVPNDGCEHSKEQRRPCPIQTAYSSAGCRSWWSAEPNVCRVAHGIPNRVDRLRALGNAVVPAQAYPLFKAIAEIERMATD